MKAKNVIFQLYFSDSILALKIVTHDETLFEGRFSSDNSQHVKIKSFEI